MESGQEIISLHRRCLSLAFARMPRAEARGEMATGDRDVPRRGKSGWLRRSLAWLCRRCPTRKRGELHFVPENAVFLGVSEIFVHLEILINEGRAELADPGPPALCRAL